MHNVEFKAELRDIVLARSICRQIRATEVVTMEQIDTYYRIPAGRLKRRECPGEPTEYIFYDRADRAQPKLSHFTIYTESQAQQRFGLSPLPVWIVVKKVRELFMHGNVRIHLDTVENLGCFLEFEALVSTSFNVAKAHAALNELRQTFAPVLGEPIGCGYSDILSRDLEDKPAEAEG